MAGSQISTSVTIVNSLLGFQAVSLTEFGTSAQSLIAAGSKVEIAGAFFTFAGDDTPQASTWTAIGTGNTAYITLTPSGTAGSQIVTSMYSAADPTWRDDLQGWYGSAASGVRYVGGVYKAGATSYEQAFILENDRTVNHASGGTATTIAQPYAVEIEIGGWDMDADFYKVVSFPFTIDPAKVRGIFGQIISDTGNFSWVIPSSGIAADDAEMQAWFMSVGSGLTTIVRLTGGDFDSATFNDDTMNRGYVTLWLSP